jgi:hypothetical protein
MGETANTTTTTTVANFVVNNYAAHPADGTQTTQTATQTTGRNGNLMSASSSTPVNKSLTGFEVAGADSEGMAAANEATDSAKPFLRKHWGEVVAFFVIASVLWVLNSWIGLRKSSSPASKLLHDSGHVESPKQH